MTLHLILVCLLAMLLVVGCAHSGGVGEYRGGVVAADHELASKAGAEILAAGGNAVDAAVATGFALSVVRPLSCGIGGGGFMVITLDDRAHGSVRTAINYRETAPAAVGADFFAKDADAEASVYGGKAVATPASVAGLLYAQEKYGVLDRGVVMGPAIRLADEGFLADEAYVSLTSKIRKKLAADPEMQRRFAFVGHRYLLDGTVKLGDRIRIPEHAAVLRAIAREGKSAYYSGEVARGIVEAVRADGGVMTMEDLAGVRVREMAPLKIHGNWPDFLYDAAAEFGGDCFGADSEIDGVGDGAAGFGFLCYLPVAVQRAEDPAYAHMLAESMKQAYADRARWLGDPDFVDVPTERLIGDEYLAGIFARLSPDKTAAPEDCGTVPPDDHGTSHWCVIDRHGNAVAATETVNTVFGSLLVTRDGIVLNNQMDDFAAWPGVANALGLFQSQRNAPAAGKTPLSSMTPTIVMSAGGEVELIAGASGGPRIISGTAQAILGSMLFGETPGEAVSRPRIHHQWKPDKLEVEEYQTTQAGLAAGMVKVGHRVVASSPAEYCTVQLIHRYPDGSVGAACDPRKGGKPAREGRN